jgi:hypothetical protein
VRTDEDTHRSGLPSGMPPRSPGFGPVSQRLR